MLSASISKVKATAHRAPLGHGTGLASIGCPPLLYNLFHPQWVEPCAVIVHVQPLMTFEKCHHNVREQGNRILPLRCLRWLFWHSAGTFSRAAGARGVGVATVLPADNTGNVAPDDEILG